MKKAILKYPFLMQMGHGFLAFYRGMFGLLRGRRGSWDHLRSSWSFVRRCSSISGHPISVTLEPINACNLRCSVCETGAGILGRSPQAMTFPEFQRIIDKISPHTNTLMFYFMGEPFLHKDAYRMIRYAKKKNIPFVTSCTNGDVVNPEKLIESEIDEISFQIGGITQQTHQTYRQGSRLDRVLDNLEKTVLARNQSGAKTQIVCGFILMKHNEHEAQAFQSMMAKIGVDRALIVDPCVRNIEQAQRMLPRDRTHWAYDPAALERGILKPRITPRNSCPWIYYSLTVQVNGDVVPCCRDPKGQYIMGNLLRQDLDEIWNGKKFQDFRKKLLTDQKHIDICRLCSGFGVSRVK